MKKKILRFLQQCVPKSVFVLIVAKKRGMQTINKKQILNKIKTFNDIGIDPNQEKKIIVSFTSFPERINLAAFAAYSLLTQTFKPSKVILWLAEEQFPNKMEDIPFELNKLRENGLEIRWCKDIRSYKKIVPAVSEFSDYDIITADDDLFYPRDYIETLLNASEVNPGYIICLRAHLIKVKEKKVLPYSKWDFESGINSESYLNFPTSGAGVYYPSQCFYKDFLNEELFSQLCPNADDLWLWFMTTLNYKKSICINHYPNLIYNSIELELGYEGSTLSTFNNVESGNDFQLNNLLKEYGESIITIINSNNEMDLEFMP